MSLKEYGRKRKFAKTPEPKPEAKKNKGKGALRFVVQKHAASRTHYDFRLEVDGALKSWAVPKGPSLLSGDPRLAVRVEDHPIAYGSFEGVIPKGNYGAGTVMIWDAGTYTERSSVTRDDSEITLRKGLEEGHITFILEGEKLKGEFALVKIKKNGAEENAWLLVKKHDQFASRNDISKEDRSAKTGRSMAEIATEAVAKGEVWLPKRQAEKKVTKERIENTRPKTTKPKLEKRARSSRELMPRRTRPMEPVFAAAAPGAEGWIFEEFGAGLRAIAEVEPGRVRLYSRTQLPYEKKFPDTVTALRGLKNTVVLDGELIPRMSKFVFVVHDILYLDGKDLRDSPLSDRKNKLSGLLLPAGIELAASAERPEALFFSKTPFQAVAKRLDSTYQSRMTRDWVKFRPRSARAGKAIVDDRPPLTHLDKVYWPDEGITKGDLIRYYERIADVILPYMIDRPQSLHRQPDGLRNEGFFHKDMNSYLPKRIQTERVHSGSSEKTVNYALCQDRWSLLYLVNLGCIEFNPWLSRRPNLDRPDFVVIDLDPDGNHFDEVIRVAREVYNVLREVGAESWCKTSGSSGLHICIPTGARVDFEATRTFAEAICRFVHSKLPALTSVERNPAKRKKRIYLDFLQNRRSQTLAAPYCVRPRPRATVSAPLKWTEVKAGLRPESFTIENMVRRLERVGDLWKPMLETSVDIEKCMKRLSKISHD